MSIMDGVRLWVGRALAGIGIFVGCVALVVAYVFVSAAYDWLKEKMK